MNSTATSGTALAVLLGLLVVGAPQAVAGTGAGSSVSFPPNVSVGQTNVSALLTLENSNTAPDQGDTNTVSDITLIPSCGQVSAGGCSSSGADPGVFQVSSTASGQSGSACAGVVFDVAPIDSTFGRVRFTPRGGPVTLPGPGGVCRIDFTVDVLKVPTVDQSPAPGIQTVQVAENTQQSSATGNVASARSTASGTTVARAITAIDTTASADAQLGSGVITDTAFVSNRTSPTPGATVVFTLYGPADATCSSTPVFTSTQPYPVSGGPITSAAYTPTDAGTYRWVASYSGDTNNLPVTGACNDIAESVSVTKAGPTIATSASPDTTLGSGQIADIATVSGRVNPQPGATVEFNLYGPGDTTCTGTPVFTSTQPYPVPEGSVTSAIYTPTTAGTYRWIAAYSGDSNNASATGACGDANETRVVAQAGPSIATTASPDFTLGTGRLSDDATVSGVVNPPLGATIHFALYGPGDTACTGTPVYSSTRPYPVDGSPSNSRSYTPTTAGTYRWIAAYSGDSNNAPVSGACNDPGESTVVSKASPTISTFASSGILLGGPFGSSGRISDDATVSGRVNPQPGATVVFDLYGPNDINCTTAPIFTSSVSQTTAPGFVASAEYTPTAPGTYRWIAAYSGDSNNAPVSGACNDPNEEVDVIQVGPPPTGAASTTTASTSPARAVVRSTRTTVGITVRSGGNPVTGGSASVSVDGVRQGTAPVVDGRASLRLPVFNTVGRRTLLVEYSGMPGTTQPSSARLSLNVVKARPRLRLSVSPATVHRARTCPLLSITATAPGQRVTGIVTVRAKGRAYARVRLVRGKAQVRLPRYFRRGLKTVQATYLGSRIATRAYSEVTFRVVRRR